MRNEKGRKMPGEKLILSTVPFSMDVVLGLTTLAIPLFAINLGASALVLGELGFVSTLCYVILTPIFGRLVDHIGYRSLLLFGVLTYFLSSLALSLSSKMYQLFLFIAFVGIAGAMFWPSFEVWLAQMRMRESLLKRVSFFNISWCLGSGIGLLIAGILFEVYSHLPFYFASFLSLAIIFLIVGKLRKKKKDALSIDSGGKRMENNSSLDSSSSGQNAPFYLYIGWVANFANYFCIGMIRYLFPKLSIHIGIKPSIIGVLLFTAAFFQTVAFYMLGKTERWHYKGTPLILSQLLVIFGLVLIFLGSTVISFLIAFMFIGVGGGLAYFSSIFYSLNNLEGKGQKSGIHEAVLGTGLLLGSLVGGAIAEAFTLRSPYVLAIFVIGAAICVETLLMKKEKKYGIKVK